ncbi:MAG: alpha/beta hydrolase, partial [Acidimicrobiia bacterium]
RTHPPAVLILRSPFTSLSDVGSHHYPWLPVGMLLRDRYPSSDTISDLDIPVLVVAGSEDRIVPAEQSRSLYQASVGPKELVIVEGADHNDFALLAGDRLIEAVDSFVTRILDSTP